MDALRAHLLPPPMFNDQQAAAIEDALRDPGPGDPGDAARRALFYGFLASHREQQAREARGEGGVGSVNLRISTPREVEEALRDAQWRAARADHQALLAGSGAEPRPARRQPREVRSSSLCGQLVTHGLA